MKTFETTVYGKWILSGEHAVLRGSPALVFPLKSRFIRLRFEQDAKVDGIQLSLEGSFGEEFRMLFWGVLEKAIEIKKIRRTEISGRLHLDCNVPIGAGLGASAALCVAVTRWLMHLQYVKESESLEFARQLENLFHGESSGVDVAVALSGKPVRFIRNQKRDEFQAYFSPKWYISYSGQRGVTAECVSKVKELLEKQPQLGQQIDSDMQQATQICEKALADTSLNEKDRLQLLAEGMDLGKSCFVRWGLCDGALAQHMQLLKDNGALAMKPTGSGQGGYVLSLWEKTPPANLNPILIECF